MQHKKIRSVLEVYMTYVIYVYILFSEILSKQGNCVWAIVSFVITSVYIYIEIKSDKKIWEKLEEVLFGCMMLYFWIQLVLDIKPKQYILILIFLFSIVGMFKWKKHK